MTKDFVAAPVPLTVESCLAELREMLPGELFRATEQREADVREDGTIHWREKYACIMQLSRGLDGFYSAATLTEAMQQVRQAKENQP